MKALRHFFVVSILLTPFFVGTVFVSPHKADAQVYVPVGDLVNLTFHAGGFQKEFSLDTIGFTLAKAAAQQIVAGMVDWIGSGFAGSPAFVTNEVALIGNAIDNVFADFVESDVLPTYDSAPFKNPLVISLAQDASTLYSSQGYNLNDTVPDVDAFLGGKFSEGGISGWYELTQNPDNNFFGAQLKSQRELEARNQLTVQQIQREVDQGAGFLSLRDGSGNITTPGKILQEQLNFQLGSGVRQLENADEFNELFSGILNTLTTAVIQEGLTSITNEVDNVINEAEDLINDQTGVGIDLEDLIERAKNNEL